MKKVFRFIWHIPRNVLILLILLYQRVLSPDHSFWAKWIYPHGYCKFYPTCSRYSIEALRKYGIIRGVLKGAWRVARCNPWNDGGIDHP